MRKLFVTLSNATVAHFFDPEEQWKVGFERHEFNIDKAGSLVIYFRIANEHVDVGRNVAAYAPGRWQEIIEVIDT